MFCFMSESVLPDKPGIYAIRCIATGRAYVGSSTRVRKRCNGHRQHLRKGRHHSSALQHAWNKYGEAGFSFELIEAIDDLEQIVAREQFWIDSLQGHIRRGGYNMFPAAGSPRGFKQTPQTIARMSAAKRGDWKMADDHKRAVSAAAVVTNRKRKGVLKGAMPDDHKIAIRQGLKGKMGGPRPWRRGTKHNMSAEGIAAKIAANKLRGPMPEKQKAAIIAANRRRKGEKRPRASV
jgi:group I intron endonuclease